jgi:hypothetical protein
MLLATFDYNLLVAETQFILDRAKIKLYFQAFWVVHIFFYILSTKYMKVFIIAIQVKKKCSFIVPCAVFLNLSISHQRKFHFNGSNKGHLQF